MKGDPWPQELVERMMSLMKDGTRTIPQMASELGVSRNAVIGKMHRLKMAVSGSFKPRPKGRTPKPKLIGHSDRFDPERAKARVRKPMPQFVAEPVVRRPIDVPVPPSLNFSLVALTDKHCHWPHGDGPNWDFCGHPVEDGPYCAAHKRLAVGR